MTLSLFIISSIAGIIVGSFLVLQRLTRRIFSVLAPFIWLFALTSAFIQIFWFTIHPQIIGLLTSMTLFLYVLSPSNKKTWD
jgi:ABC-type amino acid transport system permease subunit